MTTLFDAAPAATTAAGPRPRIIGLDLSLTSTGVALPDGTTYRIKTRSQDGDHRLVMIRDNLRRALAAHEPVHLAVVEDLPRNAMAAGVTGMVQGIARCELADAGVPVAYVVPATLKSYAADHGKADKARMAAAAYLAVGIQFTDDPGGDQCDAWWLRAAGHDWWGAPLFTLPAAQRARLTKAKWPVLPRWAR
ncbi:crossover junction endodeoxyribonuclease RuvC [Streptomyces platensis]|uniref:crossover junction endodeoxyribonuclease RuvC n=1 Tax=Streptomyces platensis TaxID=58346 RepID=UPI00378F8A92